MADIPQALLDRLDALEKANAALAAKVNDEGTLRNVQAEKEAYERRIREESMFQGLGKPKLVKNEMRLYPLRVYNGKYHPAKPPALPGLPAPEPEPESRIVTSEADEAAAAKEGWMRMEAVVARSNGKK